MTASDWIALLGALVSAAAIFVSARIALIAVRLQAKQSTTELEQAQLQQEQARKDGEKDLADVARDLSNRMAQLMFLPMGPDAVTSSSEVAGLVITAEELAGEAGGSWYLYYGLAMAHGWMWEVDKAIECWDKALAKADSGHTRVTLLSGRAFFHYNVGSPAAVDAGRSCFDQAAQILQTDSTDDLGREQLAVIYAQQAACEYNVGQPGMSASIFRKAWAQCENVITGWRKDRAALFIANNFHMTFGRNWEAIPDTIPPDLVAYAMGVQQWQGQQAPNPPQVLNPRQTVAAPQPALQPSQLAGPAPQSAQLVFTQGGGKTVGQPSWPSADPSSGPSA